jgi:ATP-dependent Lon protease
MSAQERAKSTNGSERPGITAARASRRQQDLLECNVPAVLPVLPLTSTIVFPLGASSVQVGSSRNLRLLRECTEEDAMVALAPAFGSDPEKLKTADVSRIAVAARILSRLNMPGGTVQVTLQGQRRIRIERYLDEQPFLRAKVACVVESRGSLSDENDLILGILDRFDRLVRMDERYTVEIVNGLRMNLDDPGRFADLVATLALFPMPDKQRILETLDVPERLRRVRDLVQTELERAQVDREMEARAKEEITKSRREYLLREQMKAILEELGESTPAEAEARALGLRLDGLHLPSHAESTTRGEIDRLRLISPASAEYEVSRRYIQWLLDLPWDRSCTEPVDLDAVRRVLDEDHFGLEKLKERIVEHLAVCRLTRASRGPILCFAGPPGTGKTSLGRSIARALGRKFARISVGGLTDEAEIRGHRRTYVGAMPGRIVASLAQVGCSDPVLMIDEIDKMGRSVHGDPASAMLEVLDPEQNAAFVDHYLNVPFDLSRVLFICTANTVLAIPKPLLDRMEVLPLSSYTEEEKLEIVKRHLLPVAMRRAGLEGTPISLPDETLRRLVREYTSEAGLRDLERQVDAILRKVATRVALGGTAPAEIAPDDVEAYLGPPEFLPVRSRDTLEVGVATGLAWTPAGGEILTIEALKMPGHGEVVITGHLGGVMQESVIAAFSYVKSRAESLEVDPADFERHDVHVHFPGGAVPKDGPSAGIAVALAFASLFTDRPIRNDVAMTGEITLRGKVLPIGGVKEKVLAAHRSGIRTVILPRQNEKDLIEVPASVRQTIQVVLVDTVDEVLEEGILPIVVPSRLEKTVGVIHRRDDSELHPR